MHHSSFCGDHKYFFSVGQLNNIDSLTLGLGIGDLSFVTQEKSGCGYKNSKEIISFKKTLNSTFSKVNESPYGPKASYQCVNENYKPTENNLSIQEYLAKNVFFLLIILYPLVLLQTDGFSPKRLKINFASFMVYIFFQGPLLGKK